MGAAFLLLTAILLVSAVTGYSSGVSRGRSDRATRAALSNQEQFNLGVEDFLAGRYALARQRFEYILSVDPDYPGAADMLAEILRALNVPTSSPTWTSVPATPTTTLDVSSLDGLLAQAQASFNGGDWSGALRALLAVRAEDPAYRLDEVNALMAASLRNQGLEKILQGYLEQGIFDLALAERFGALDTQAIAWRNTAAFYLVANSYIGLDWPQAAEYFQQVCQTQNWDSCGKYALAAMRFGDLLVATADPCGAVVQYQASLNIYLNSLLFPTATRAANACLTATAATPTETPTLETPAATIGTPTDTPTTPPPEETPATSTPTLTATETLTPTPSPSQTT